LLLDFMSAVLLTFVEIQVTPPFHCCDVAEPPAKYTKRKIKGRSTMRFTYEQPRGIEKPPLVASLMWKRNKVL
jgi:hypothetical protein